MNKATYEIKKILSGRVDFEELVDRLTSLTRQGNVRAIELLLAYRYGRPKLTEEIRAEISRPLDETTPPLATMSTEELTKRLLERLKLSCEGIETP